MFETSLNDVIRGIRAATKRGGKEAADAYIAQCISECRSQVTSSDASVCALTVLKLTYLHMLGHDMNWASLHVLRCMASTAYAHKAIGYLAACTAFGPHTDVLLLATNQLKKDMAANHARTTCAAVSCLAEVATRELAADGDLARDLVGKLAHPDPYTRRRVLLAVCKVAAVYPDILREPGCMDRLAGMLDFGRADDPHVASTAIHVICELAMRPGADASVYLPLAPQLFRLLASGTDRAHVSNWTLIKLVKMFAHLAILEPRLVRKLAGPMRELISGTTATSLLYEAIHAALAGGLTNPQLNPDYDPLARLCATKLAPLLASRDPNLRYVALVAAEKLIAQHPHLGEPLEAGVFECLEATQDPTIRDMALDVLARLATAENVVDVINHLFTPVESAVAPEQLENQDGAPTSERQVPQLDKKATAVILDLVARFGGGSEWHMATLARIVSHASDAAMRSKSVSTHLANQILALPTSATLLLPLLCTSPRAWPANVASAVLWAAGHTPAVRDTLVQCQRSASLRDPATHAAWCTAAIRVGVDVSTVESFARGSASLEACERANLARLLFAADSDAARALFASVSPSAGAAPPPPPPALEQWHTPASRDFFERPPTLPPAPESRTASPPPRPTRKLDEQSFPTSPVASPESKAKATARAVLRKNAAATMPITTSQTSKLVDLDTPPGSGTATPSADATKPSPATNSMWTESVTVENEDFVLTLHLGPPRAPSSFSSSTSSSSSSATSTWLLPLTITVSPTVSGAIAADTTDLTVHVAVPAGVRAAGVPPTGVLSCKPHQRKLVLLAMRGWRPGGVVAVRCNALCAELPLRAVHVVTPLRNIPPAEFERRTTTLPATASVRVAAPAYADVARRARLAVVEAIGSAASLAGTTGNGLDVAAMAKWAPDAPGVIDLQVRAAAEWVAQGVIEAVAAAFPAAS